MQVDPQLAYINTAWWLEDATGTHLYRWSHGAKLMPEVASRVVVSDGGLAYTFTLRRVFRFSDGTPVSARGFAYAIRRLRNRDLASPGAAPAVGIARVTAGGRRLVIRLAWANPYWTHGSPGQLDGVDIRWNQDPNTVVGEVEAGRLDEVAGIPAAQRQSLADRYGVGNGRFRVRPSAGISAAGRSSFTSAPPGVSARRKASSSDAPWSAWASSRPRWR